MTRPSVDYTDDEDSEPGDFLKTPDPNCRADRVCPCGGVRNWNQELCDCGNGTYWPVEDGEQMKGLVKCAGYKRNKWRRRRNRRKRTEEAASEEQKED